MSLPTDIMISIADLVAEDAMGALRRVNREWHGVRDLKSLLFDRVGASLGDIMKRAAQGGRVDIVDEVEERCSKDHDVNVRKCMNRAAACGHVGVCERIMESRFWGELSVTEMMDAITSACESAIAHGRMSTFHLLYNDFYMCPSDALHMLGVAAKFGRYEIFEQVFNDVGVIPAITHKKIVMYVARSGNVDIMKLVIHDNRMNRVMKSEALVAAAAMETVNSMRMCEYLLDLGASPCHKSSKALQVAAEFGSMELAAVLLDKKRFKRSAAKAPANKSWALVNAAEGGHAEMCELLIEHGADPTTMSDLAIRKAYANDHVDVVEALLAAGANADAVCLPSRAMFEALSKHRGQ